MTAIRTRRTTRGLLALGAAAAVLLAGCSGSGSDSSTEEGFGGSSAQEPARGTAQDAAGRDAAEKPQSSGGSVGSVDPAALQASRDYLARSAMVALQVKSIEQAAAQVRALNARLDGIVLSENIGGGGDVMPLDPSRVTAETYGEITISVPADKLDAALTELSKLGTVIRRDTQSENVHDQYVDTDSRIKTMRASVDRVRALMARATDISQIVTLESELSRRQAELESLQSQLASLQDRIDRSPIQVSLTTDRGVIAEDPGTGFLAGLKAGWQAFADSVVVLLTVLGAVLPFAFVLALIGIPLWLVLRRRRSAARPAGPAPTAQPAAHTAK